MNDATVTFGYDGAALNAGLRNAETRIKSSAGKMEQSLAAVGKKGGSSFRSLGNASMQIQDIAVQLQMGTSKSIILAQQGSQLLSVFGPAGMLAGGAIAIGGAFYTMGERAEESFNKTIASSKQFEKESALLIQATNADNLASSLSRVSEEIAKIQSEQESLNSFLGDFIARSAKVGRIPAIFGAGGDEVEASKAQLEEARAKQAEIYAAAVDRALVASNQEVKVMQLMAAGREDEAKAMRESFIIANKLAKIDGMRIQEWSKLKLKEDVVKVAELEKIAASEKELFSNREKAQEEIAKIEEKLASDKLRQLDPVERYLELSKQQEAVLGKMAEQGGMFFDQSIEGVEAWSKALKESGDVETLAKAMKIMEESTDLQKQMAEAEREITMQRDQRDAEADKKREQDKAEKSKLEEQAAKEWEAVSLQEQGKRNLREEIMLLEAKAAGQTDLVNRMERELRIREKTKEIQAQTGINELQARQSAERIIGLEDAAQQQAAASARMPRRMMGGLDEGPLSQRAGMGRGRMMGLPDSGPISSRSARSTTNPDLSRAASSPSGQDVGGKLDKTNSLLERVFFAAS